MTKLAAWFIFIFSFAIIDSYAETKYVTENLSVMIRTGPAIERRIISMPISGTPLEVLETQEDGWARVRLPNEKEGWVLGQYLDSGPPTKEVAKRLRQDNSTLSAKVSSLSNENAELKKEKDTFEKAYKEQKNTAESLRKAYDSLRAESTEFLAVKAAYEETRQQLGEKTQQMATLESVVDALRKDQSLWWLIAGSGAVLLGFIIGYASRRPKRSSYLR